MRENQMKEGKYFVEALQLSLLQFPLPCPNTPLTVIILDSSWNFSLRHPGPSNPIPPNETTKNLEVAFFIP